MGETSSGNQAPLPGTRGEDLSAKEEIGKGVSAQKGKKRKQRRGMKGLERSDLQPSNETSGPRAPKKRKTEEVSSAGQGASELGESERGAAEQVDRENQSGAGIDHILKDYDLEGISLVFDVVSFLHLSIDIYFLSWNMLSSMSDRKDGER